eukprot:Blabericola_migrator_1__2768@NODE_1790_length_3787_cov_21_397849_g1154_i0_p1_GENE_NODE_1790_length_3787_cov_21_397849_g1154_i0NODE_1790_length_3787_cov_21_397849_g1154_i0_p1_ORF_typecomplete_len459_score104_52TrmO/PF01980_16/7_3e03TrmO/PF01980_16/3_9e33EMP24_GP25L/PF01105_24/0_18_NODE_1790_length_3787_cov_21_397849_g1154_i022813657
MAQHDIGVELQRIWDRLQKEGLVADLKLPCCIPIKKPRTEAYGVWTTSIFTRLRHQSYEDSTADYARLVAEIWEKEARQESEDESVYKMYRVESRSTGFLNFFFRDPHRKEVAENEVSPDEAQSFSVAPIGVFSSCYKQKFGTPRQGLLAPSSYGVVTMRHEFNADWTHGLEGFSHVWLIFLFDSACNKAFVDAPKATEKVGIFSSRSPHRPNPIGLTLCKLEGTCNRQIFVTGHDLLDGTLILDIKPLHPMDIIPKERITTPIWVSQLRRCEVTLDHLVRGRIFYGCLTGSVVVELPHTVIKSFMKGVLNSWCVMRLGKMKKKVKDEGVWALLDECVKEDDIPTQLRLAQEFCDKAQACKKANAGGFPPFELYPSPVVFLKNLVEMLTLDPRTKKEVQEVTDGPPHRYQIFLDNFEVVFEPMRVEGCVSCCDCTTSDSGPSTSLRVYDIVTRRQKNS